jgi:hypothetical protein
MRLAGDFACAAAARIGQGSRRAVGSLPNVIALPALGGDEDPPCVFLLRARHAL